MVFSSLFFLYTFLPLCLIVYQLPSTMRGKNMVLLCFSLVFYAWGEPLWILQMLLSGTLVFFFGLLVDSYRRERKLARLFLILSVTTALLPLFLFKYSAFFIENINALTGLELPLPQITMPIGISFYTFQIISYVVDLYRGNCRVQRFLPDFILYEALFPQLIAGPIVRYSDVERELRTRAHTSRDLAEGSVRFVSGLAKKTLLANHAGSIVEQTLGGGKLGSLSGLEALIGIFAFTFQIYFDFSAYSDMAIGLGRLFGFHFKENFNYPYFAKSVTDFWRRWHISLSSFFRDYVYIPLGGKYRHPALNLALVWFLTGFWHGASWNFILWGLYYLLFLLLERYVFGSIVRKMPRFPGVLITWVIAAAGWSLFYFTDLSELALFARRLFTLDGNPFSTIEGRLLFRQNIIFFLIAYVLSLPVIPWLKKQFSAVCDTRFSASGLWLAAQMAYVLLLLFLSTAALAGASFNPFLYFRF